MPIDQRPPAIFLMGPTASGKTALALAWAQRWPLAAISVDSALVYRGMDIGTAKPDADTLGQVPHALVDIREPEQGYSAAEFAADARAAMDTATAAGRIPLLVGGTGLYFRALEHGLSALPEADPALRATLEAEARADGLGALHQRLVKLDPVAGARIHRNDPQRIQRALEVIALTGKPLSAQQSQPRSRLPYRLLKLIAMPPDRGILHERIAQRFRTMLDHGLIEEVRKLRGRPGLSAEHPAMRAVGYRQTWQYLAGEINEEELLARGIFATRQLAKRQSTWLRGEHDALGLDPSDPEAQAAIERLVAGCCVPRQG